MNRMYLVLFSVFVAVGITLWQMGAFSHTAQVTPVTAEERHEEVVKLLASGDLNKALKDSGVLEHVHEPVLMHRCWDDTNVLVVRNGTEPLLPSPRPKIDPHDWRFTNPLILEQQDNNGFLVSYGFERYLDVPVSVSCDGIFEN